jgi:hypothetical protein
MLGSDDLDSYEQQGFITYDKLLVPLTRTHKVVSTLNDFGVKTPKGELSEYCLDTASVKQSRYDTKLTRSCNPKGFEHVPIARTRTTSNVPPHHLQIRAIRYQVRAGDSRWLGLQGDKYVTLPKEWVELNFDPLLRKEAKDRAEGTKRKEEDMYVRVQPGDSRTDDPPIELRDKKGNNYYYQGKHDNCLMGGLANAVFAMCGSSVADQLLKDYIPLKVDCWHAFVKHVNATMSGYQLCTVQCLKVLKWDDLLPIVVQLCSNDMSENHAVCFHQGSIYDSASRYVLIKNEQALSWCSGIYGFKRHLHLYQLQKIAAIAAHHLHPLTTEPNENRTTKKKRRRRK